MTCIAHSTAHAAARASAATSTLRDKTDHYGHRHQRGYHRENDDTGGIQGAQQPCHHSTPHAKPIKLISPAISHAILHVVATQPIAHLSPSSRRTDVTAATQGV